MEWRWGWLWSILWNILLHAVTLQWSELSRDAESFKSWWRSLWSEIENRVNGVRSWARGEISWLRGYAFGLYVQAVNLINDKVNSLRSWAQGKVSWLQGYAFGLYVQALNWTNSQVNAARSWAQGRISWVQGYAFGLYVQALDWARGAFQWIQPYRDLIVNWLVQARGAIDWLWHYGRAQLQAFLNDPLGYVLGSWLTWLRTIVNFWQLHGAPLMTFTASELADLRTTWANGKRVLNALVDNPEQFIFDLLAPKFLDWLAGLIADSW